MTGTKVGDNHKCLHEEQIIGQSRAIERLNAELGYKKEKLDDLKKDNRRMEEKIDNLTKSVNDLVLQSKTDDDKLELRLKAIETEQKVIKEQNDKNRADFNTKLVFVSIVLGILTIYFNYLR